MSNDSGIPALPIPGQGYAEPVKLGMVRELARRADQLWKDAYKYLGNEGGVSPALDVACGAIERLRAEYQAKGRPLPPVKEL